jgi:hypothetical protein
MKTTETTVIITTRRAYNGIDDCNVTYVLPVATQANDKATAEEAFKQTQHALGVDVTNHWIERECPKVPSTSVGDLVIVNGTIFLVDSTGMRKLTNAEAIAWQKVSIRDASFGWDFCVENNLIKLAA